MTIKIDNASLLAEKLCTGISLFTGAGFSLLPDQQGKTLPEGLELAQELVKKFDIDEIYEDDLTYISEQCPKEELDSFLRKRFTVTSYNPLYKVLNKIKINTYVTTNIDNILRSAVRDGNMYYINNMREYGAPMNNPNELYYIPLHGDVLDKNSNLYFSKSELTQVTTENKDLFDAMYTRLSKDSVLFIGYSFKDGGVMKVVTELIRNGCHDIWIQCMPTDKKNIVFFKNKGCNIIEADTEALLKWIEAQENVKSKDMISQNSLCESLKAYRIPSLSDVPAIQNAEYLQKGNTDWYPILVNVPYERKEVNLLYNEALRKKHAILIGEKFTGKTTVLMQTALKVVADIKLYLDAPRVEEAIFVCGQIQSQKAWIFIHNCTADIEAFKVFTAQPNLYVIGSSNEYQYETVRHLIDNEISYSTINVSELSQSEAREIYNKVPTGLKGTVFKYKSPKNNDDKYSMLEFVGNNIVNSFTKRKIASMLDEMLKKNKMIFEIITLTAYLSENYSALSYNILASYFNIPVYPNAVELVKQAKEYLRSYAYDSMDVYEDYYLLRSKLFATNTRELLIRNHKTAYAAIIEKFIKTVSSFRILRYDIFRRKAYDAELFSKLFSYEQSNEIFSLLYQKNPNCYTLQQWALCKMKFKHYKEAFADIDHALSLAPNNFSIQNSQAIILFEANKYDYSETALNSLKEAMSILRDCYNNDKRKIYHSQKFAEFAIILQEKHNCKDFIEDAKKWILETIQEQGENISKKTKELKARLDKI